MTARVPMSVVGGFLGAGKTTLLNRVLGGRHGVRYAVLVNDFGALEVDGALVAAHGGDTVVFANGCVCCTMGDDLVGAVDRLLDADRPPDQLLVEASGVADPSAIAEVAALHPGLARDLVVVLADAETVRARHGDERLRDTLDRQLAAADLLVLNKCDRVPEDARRAVEAWLRDRAGAHASVVRAVDADIPMEVLSAGSMGPTAPAGPLGGEPEHSHRFRAHVAPCPDPIDPERLRAALRALSPRTLRAKGFVVSARAGEPAWMLVQACGESVEIEAWRPPAGQPAPIPGIVFIGLDDLPAADDLRAAVQRASAPATP